MPHDVRHFTFLSRCRPGADIILGDARLSLAREPAGRFDYLVIDAFSSDAIPVHLLTREAIALFLHKLAPEGILALHISNRHLDLPAIAAATALSVPRRQRCRKRTILMLPPNERDEEQCERDYPEEWDGGQVRGQIAGERHKQTGWHERKGRPTRPLRPKEERDFRRALTA